MTTYEKLIAIGVWVALVVVGLLCFSGIVKAADITVSWDASADATGYKIYRSTDLGNTWTLRMDVGNLLTYNLTGEPDTGLVLYRVSAYDTNSEAIRYWSGAWMDQDWKPVEDPGGTGIQ